MKTQYLFLLVVLFFIFASSSLYSQKAGIYGSQATPQNYIQLKSDRSFFLKKGSQMTVGKYSTDGEFIVLTAEGGYVDRLTIHGEALIDNQKEYWNLWRGGKSVKAYEESHKTLDEMIDELEKQVSIGKMTQADADKRIDDLRRKQERSAPQPASTKKYDIKTYKLGIINHLENLAANAINYFTRPRNLNGGEGSYVGYVIPPKMATNELGSFSATLVHDTLWFKGIAPFEYGSIEAPMDTSGYLCPQSMWKWTGKFKQ